VVVVDTVVVVVGTVVVVVVVGTVVVVVVAVVVVVVASFLPAIVGSPAGAAIAPTASIGLTTCLDQSPKIVVRGSQTVRYRHPVDTATAFDAGTARWLQVGVGKTF